MKYSLETLRVIIGASKTKSKRNYSKGEGQLGIYYFSWPLYLRPSPSTKKFLKKIILLVYIKTRGHFKSKPFYQKLFMSTSIAFASTKSAQDVVTSKQSQKLVQTMLIMSFGCITYLRGLFDEGCFTDQKYYPNKSHRNEDGVVDSSNSIRVKTLVRGKSLKIDSLLDWLDKGVFPLISSKYLKALSFSIYLDESCPLDLAESYTFSFNYDNDDVHMNIESKTLSGENNITTPFGLLDSRKAVERLMRNLIILTQSFPALPLTRNLNIRLLFNDRCPMDYQPSELFKDISKETQPKIAIDKLDYQERSISDRLITPFHQVGVRALIANTEEPNADSNVRIDPFDLCDETFYLNIPSRVTTLYQPKLRFLQDKKPEPSQVTSELKSFLEQHSRTGSSAKLTQAVGEMENFGSREQQEVEGFNCECGSRIPLSSIEFKKLQCPACHKNKHVSCYGFELNFKNVPPDFKCYSCRSKERDRDIHPELPILMNVRKLYRLINKQDIPESISSLAVDLGLDIENGKSLLNFTKAINVLVFDGILVFSPEPIQKASRTSNKSFEGSNNFIIGSDYIEVDIEGISDGINDIKLGKCGLTFTPLMCRYKRPIDEAYNMVVKERKNFYFNLTQAICFDEEDLLSSRPTQKSQNRGTFSDDPIVEDSQSELQLFESLLISGDPKSKKRQLDEVAEEIVDSIEHRKQRKISSIKKDLRFK